MGSETNAVVSAMVTAITTIASDATSGIAAIVPVAAPVLGGMILIGVCVRTVRKFTGR